MIRNTKDVAERFGVSMEPQLLAAFDAALISSGYECRSEAVRDLARRWLADRAVGAGRNPAIGVLSFVYDHDRHELSHRLAHLQHQHHTAIVTTVHVHLDARLCLEVLIIRGRAERVRAVADQIIALKSVQQGRLTLLALPATEKGE